ncbi:MAG TPA: hypothetical protein VFB26_06815 [Gaiellaceae bacterium]|nr:hypothetical protein [Gaiellaceae bacterium]
MPAFLHVQLEAPGQALPALRDLYTVALGLEPLDGTTGGVGFRVGETELQLGPGGDAFYYLALLVPGDRLAAARDWAAERVELLPDPDSDEVVFDFSFWKALACYFEDPAGNIVELIAHAGIGESGRSGAFAPEELLGVSELGLVGGLRAMADGLRGLGLDVWDGSVEAGRLAFVGERARTLILAPPGRGWLPTGRPAEVHPVDVTLAGPPAGEVVLEGGAYRVRRVAGAALATDSTALTMPS